MYRISLKDFRGFHKQEEICIRPITILLGENSSGKSSFLAALNYMLTLLSGAGEPSFNKDPFQLGTFQQIAHFRGGRGGRAREFALSLGKEITLSPRRPQGERNLISETMNVLLKVTFTNLDSHAMVSSMEVSGDSKSLKAKIEGGKAIIEYIDETNNISKIDLSKTLSRISRFDLIRLWPFLFRDLSYHIKYAPRVGRVHLPSKNIERQVQRLSSASEKFFSDFSARIEATSAIRTKPQRTYTPGLESRDGEGSHVPYEIAKLYRASSKDAWRNLKSSIELFGKSSDMFNTIDVKSFGKTASDPFQIQFSFEGPRMNLVDLGYGTSQVLPILYIISTGPKRSTYLIQQPEVHLHPRAQAALGSYFVEEFRNNNKNFILETHSDFVVDRIRHSISSGLIKSDDVSVLFFQRGRLENTVVQIELDDSGTPIAPPVEYRNFFIGEQIKILGIE